MSENIFEKATRKALRFATAKGILSVEDLWGLTPAQLDPVAIALHKELQDQEVSFVKKPSRTADTIQLRFDVVKHIIDTKLAELEEAKLKSEKEQRRRVLLEALADKEEDALKAKTKDEILKELEELSK